MAVTVVEALSNVNSGAAASVTTGAGTSAGDVLLAIGFSDFFALSTGFGPPTGGGWTATGVDADRGTNDAHIRAWTKTVTSAGAVSVSLSPIVDEDIGLTVLVLRSVDTTTPLDGTPAAQNSSAATPSVFVAASVSPSTTDALLVVAAMTQVNGGSGTFSPPGSMAERADFAFGGSFGACTVATEQLSASGATGSRSFTYSIDNVAGTALALAVRVGEYVPPTTPTKVADRGSAQNLTSQSSTAVDLAAGGSVAADNFLIARLALDNAGTSGAAVSLTVTDPQSNTWTVVGPANQDPGNVNAGATCYIAYAKVVNAYSDGDDITFNYGGVNVPAKSIVVEEWANIDPDSPVAVAATTATGASGTPSISRTPTAVDQLFYGALAIEGPSGDTYTQDSDTTDGTWDGLTSLSTTSGTAASNQTVRGASKLVTGTSAQTWNPGITSRDWAAVALVFSPAPQGTDLTAADVGHAHAAEEPALTQTHALTGQDAGHGHTADQPTLTQVHDLSVDDASHGHAADQATVAQPTPLAPDDASHNHTADAPALTQVHTLSPAHAAHGHAAQLPSLAQIHQLEPDAAMHAHVAEAPALTQAHALVAADAEHGHSAEPPALAQAHNLPAADSSHAHAVEEPTLGQLHGVGAQNATHAHTADQPALSQAHNLTSDDAGHGHTAEQVTLGGSGIIAVDGAGHGHSADGPTLTQTHGLAADETSHGQTAQAPPLAQDHALAALDAGHSHAATLPTLGHVHHLAAADAGHGHLADASGVTAEGDLAPADATHAHTAEPPALAVSVTPANATHGHAAASPALTQTHMVAADAAAHAHVAEQAAISQLQWLVPDDASHGHAAGGATVDAGLPAARGSVTVRSTTASTTARSTTARTSVRSTTAGVSVR